MKDPTDRLAIVKTIRFSEVLLRNIVHECEIRSLAFSDFMRAAAIAAMKQQQSAAQSGLEPRRLPS
jgi:hypothetical protein